MNDAERWPCEAEPGDDRNEPDLRAGKWRVSLIDATNTSGPLVHLGHPDLVEEQGQMDPHEGLALGIALIRQASAALASRPARPGSTHPTRPDDRPPEGTGEA